MLKLFFDLKYQNITLTNPGVTVASDSKNYLVAKFNAISNDWETPLSAIFVSTVDKVAYTVLVGQSANLEADECYVPWEVLKDSGEVYVSVFSGNLHTTNVAKFAVVKSGYVEGEIPPPPTPTVYEQILEELENKQDVIHLDNAIDEVYNPNGHYVLYYFDSQDIRHNIFDFEIFQELTIQKIYEILDQTLQGAQNVAPSLYVEPKGNNYALVYEDSEDVKHELFDFSNLPIGGTSDYQELENKPQINSHTLSGNQSSDDLGLQKKLTAGQNITIGNDGTISASGSITSYNDLTDQPNISNYALNQQEQVHPLMGTLDLYPFISSYNSSTKKNSLRLDSSQLFEAFKVPFTIYNFEDLPTSHGVFVCHYADSGYFTPLPDFIKPLYNFLVVYNLYTGTGQGLAQLLFWKDKNDGEAKSAFRVSAGNYNTVSPWREIGGGAQIVSGVVNQNGTITFTDSDGNTFTTTGLSVIGADGVGIADVHIDGGGDLIIEYTTGHMENVGHVVGADGQDYVLTAQDKSDIADIVLSELPNADTMSF